MATVIARACAPLLLAFATALPARARAQEPQLINYEGRATVNGQNFKGPGQFKFALVDPAGTTTRWSNDGSSTAGSEPNAAVTLTVTKGRYAVRLGDATLPNMTAVPAEAFTQADLRLRVWFNDGLNGSQLLTPDQWLVAPENAPQPHTRQVRSDGTTTADVWEQRGALNPPPSGRFGHTAVWTGSEMIVWGGQGGGSTGGRYTPASDSWTAVSATGAPAMRSDHTAVWTGSEMIVWGGFNGNYLNDGGRYNPAANTWTAVTGAPVGRRNHTAAWTGSEMIVWGGFNGNYLNDGGRYHPLDNTWTAVTTAGAPAARTDHTAVWTGSEMIVWGGGSGISPFILNDGGRYNPAANSWTAVSMSVAPGARYYHTAMWTGLEMIVWGGVNSGGHLNDGGCYDPVGNTWTRMNTGAPAGRAGHTAVWTGREMIVWGGTGFIGPSVGGRYNPVANRWTAVSTTGAPSYRFGHTAVWTGIQMIVWGGWNGTSYFNDTFSYYTPDSGDFHITSVVRSGANLTLSFPTVTNCTYTIWRSDTLADDTWRDAGRPPLTGTGAVGTFTVPATTPASGFFRVQAAP